MATADVITISDPEDVLSRGLSFNNVLVTAAPSEAAAKDPTSANSRFALNNKSFIDLQLYLKAVQKLPQDDNAFEAEYPVAAFKTYLGEDLWKSLRAVLSGDNGIYKHCEKFQTTTIVDMRTFCGGLVNFSANVKEASEIIEANKPLILTDPINKKSPEVENALSEIFRVCNSLKSSATTAQLESDRLSKAFAAFKEITLKDKEALNKTAAPALTKLPNWDTLRADINQKMNEALGKLRKCFEDQVKLNRERGFPQGGTLYTSVLGYSAYVSDNDMLEKLKKIDNEVSGYFQDIEGHAAAALKLKSKATALTDLVKGIENTIEAAITALDKISGVFSIFTSKLGDILNEVGNIDSQARHEYIVGRRAINGTIKKVAGAWAEIYEAAAYYQKEGALAGRETPAPTIPPIFGSTKDFEIVGANFGSQDVTTVARIIHHMDEDKIKIPALIREFGDPWPSVEKAYNLLYKTNKEFRAFVAFEYAKGQDFTYILPKNPAYKDLGGSDRVKEEFTVSEDGCLGTSSKIDILGVVWGLGIVKDGAVYKYISNAADTNGVIYWHNDTMGGDTWRDSLKTGTIYYRHKGATEVRQISGKEGKYSYWTLP